MIKKSFLRTTLTIVAILILLCIICLVFVRFYPFPKSPFVLKANYPVVTTTVSGRQGDPVNVIFVGSSSVIETAFVMAGWKVPDPITPKSSAKIAVRALANLPYPTAPVSNLYLYGRKQDLAFERPTNTAQVRDHIRIWDTHTKFGSEEVWLGSATFDHGIELSSKSDMPTHHVSPNVDRERNAVYQALKPFMRFAVVVPFRQPNLFGVNGGGDWYYTDGNIAILSEEGLDDARVVPQRTVALKLKDWAFEVTTTR